MKRTEHPRKLLSVIGVLAVAFLLPRAVSAAGFEVVQGPGADAACFKPWSKDTKFLQFKKKAGPYRIALDNGFIGNGWRIQMIKSAKAYAEQPAVKAKLKEFKVVSTGEDLPAQIAAANNFIDAGYDAVIVNALNPAAFAPVAKRAKAAGVVLLSFDNVIESDDNIQVNVDQVELGRIAARWLLKNVKVDGKLLEIRGPSGNSVDRDRHDGFHDVLNKSGRKFEVVEVVGKWDDGTGQKAAADAIAVHKHFDGVYTQGGSTGAVRALLDSGHPMVPIAGETENGFRKLCAQYESKGLHCSSAGTGPAQVSVTIKAAIAALEGQKVPQSIALPTSFVEYPNIKEGTDFYPKLADNFFVGNSFEACKIGFTAEEIMTKSEANQ
ncbi:MAG TPA: sugar ABC transporter substrate-binding protein [Vicinamibacteria bacterium]|nr:sugar ABC transporter substrate-binding protein [Vicinamibacteria bacterium]